MLRYSMFQTKHLLDNSDESKNSVVRWYVYFVQLGRLGPGGLVFHLKKPNHETNCSVSSRDRAPPQHHVVAGVRCRNGKRSLLWPTARSLRLGKVRSLEKLSGTDLAGWGDQGVGPRNPLRDGGARAEFAH